VWFDFDNDGWADVLCSGGWNGGYGNRLFHNNRDGTFTQVEETNFAGRETHTFWATVADFNDDGFLDVIAGNGSETVNENPVLYLNQGTSGFTMIKLDRSAILGGTDVRAWGVAALDYDGDGLADLALARIDTAGRNYLLKNTGGGVFSAITNTAWTLQGSSDPVSSADYDGDGAPDLLGLGVSRTFLSGMPGQGIFASHEQSAQHFPECPSLNSAWGDFDNDGDLDVAITYVGEASKDLQVFLNDGSGNFTLGFRSRQRAAKTSIARLRQRRQAGSLCNGFNSRSRLYRNLGGGTFMEVLDEPLAQDAVWAVADSGMGRLR
jgi:hypothetical protein